MLANLFLGTLLENLFLATLLEKLFLGTLLGNLFLETLPGNFFREPYLWTCSWETCLGLLGTYLEPCLGTSSWQPCLGTCLGTLLVNLFLGTLYGHLFWELGTCGGEPCLGTSSWKHCLGTSLLGTLLGTSSWKPLPGNTCLKTCSGNLVLLGKTCSLKSCLGNGSLDALETVAEIRACKTCYSNPCLGTCSCEILACKPVPSEPCLGTCSWKPLPGNPCLGTSFWEPCLGTSSWEPLLGNLFLGTLAWGTSCWEALGWGTFAWEHVPGNLAWNLLGTLPGSLFLKTFLLITSSWEPCLGNSCWEPLLVAGEACLGMLLGTSSCQPCLGTLLGNLGTCSWEVLGNLTWEPLPGNLAWEPLAGSLCLGTCSCEPGFQPCSVRIWLLRGILLEKETLPGNPVPNLAPCGFGCSGLLRNLYYGWRPQSYAVGEKHKIETYWKSCRGVRRCRDFVGFASGFSREDLHEDVPGSWRRPPANRENAESMRKAEPPERRPMKTTKHQQRTHDMPMKHHETAQLNHKETTTDIRKLAQLRRLVFKCFRMTLRNANSSTVWNENKKINMNHFRCSLTVVG